MKVAVMTDLHGNLEAVEAVLAQMDRENPDWIVCAGDISDPLRETREVWELLKEREIPCLRGNHEDYLIGYHMPESRARFLTPAFRPVKLVAEYMGPETADEFRALPLSLRIPGPGGRDVLVCHASPTSNLRSFYDELDAQMERELDATRAAVVVSGHRHVQWSTRRSSQLLISVGSVGIPLNGRPAAEYVLLSCTSAGEWEFEHRAVPYSVETTLRRYREGGWVAEGDPIAWLLYDEIATGVRRLSPFMSGARARGLRISDEGELRSGVKEFLEGHGRWDSVRA